MIQKIGLFGGTFNPIHNGHLATAEYILGVLDLTRILFIPSNIPPHKSEYVSAIHRKNMVQLAINNNNKFGLSTVEISRGGPSYTLDTLKHFSKTFKTKIYDDYITGYEFYFIIGVEAFLEIETWGGWDHCAELFSLCNWAVISRITNIGESISDVRDKYNKFIYSLPQHVVSKSRLIAFYEVPDVDISASNIRNRIKNNTSIKYFVPDSVIKYINDNNLYKSQED